MVVDRVPYARAVDVVTGAFGYIGRYLARALLARGRSVRTITTHPEKPNPFGSAVAAFPYGFDDPGKLVQTLRGADALFNTYWIRFPFGGLSYADALANTRSLFNCAREAGVKRIVHIGVTHASATCDLPYYRGKTLRETMLRESGVAFSVIRPTLVFGEGDILVNNIAWLVRKSPVFPIAGSGRYRVQPVFAEDLAEIAIEAAAGPPGGTIDAIGPETFTFEQLVKLIAEQLDERPWIVKVPPSLCILGGRLLGVFLRDVLLTRDELRGLMDERLTSPQPPNGTTRFSDWLHANRAVVGRRYASELARHFRWPAP